MIQKTPKPHKFLRFLKDTKKIPDYRNRRANNVRVLSIMIYQLCSVVGFVKEAVKKIHVVLPNIGVGATASVCVGRVAFESTLKEVFYRILDFKAY